MSNLTKDDELTFYVNSNKVCVSINELKNKELEDNLFKQLQKGFSFEKSQHKHFKNFKDVSLYLANVYPKNALSSLDQAFYTGRLQALLGAFFNTISDITDRKKCKEAEKRDKQLSYDFSVSWQNALYLSSINK